jgi:tRNA threonylcarbamoyladenosine biosynthesis protein TsaE
MVQFTAATAEELFEAGRRFATELTGRETVLLAGIVGAGKTTFIKGVCTALGVAYDEVSSPSFALIHQYEGRYPIVHIDLYRLGSYDEFEIIGASEFMGRFLTFIEWPDIIEDDITDAYIKITLTILHDGSRKGLIERKEEA